MPISDIPSNIKSLGLKRENNFNKTWRKLAKNLFANKERIEKNELEKIIKTYLNPGEVDVYDLKAFDTEFSWKDIITAFGNEREITKKELYKKLKKAYYKIQ